MSNEQKVKTFMEKYNTAEDVARRYLSENDWELDSAMSHYTADNEHVMDADEVKKNEERVTGVTDKKIVTLESIRSIDTKKDDTESVAYYSAGSGSTGQQILDPPKSAHLNDSTQALTTVSSDRSLHSWGKGGVRLCDTSTTTPSEENHSQDNAPSNDVTYIVLHLWEEGYSINDGELRSYDIEENIRFLEAMLSNKFPPDLAAYGKKIDITIDDRSNEKFRHLNSRTYYGSGHLLGSPTPALEVPPLETTATTVSAEDNENLARDNLKLNENAPWTTIQIRLTDGSRLVARFNLNHTVGHIYRYVRDARPEYQQTEFILMTIYPRLDLINEKLTLNKTNLKNIVLVQRLSMETE